MREAAQEIGAQAAARIMLRRQELRELTRLQTDGKDVVTFGLVVEGTFLQILQLGPASGGIRLVTKDAEIRDLRTFDKTDGVIDRRVTAMFPDEADAVRRAFELLG